MVQQHASSKATTNQIEEMNEFQLVHALITQSLKGAEKESTAPSTSDENHNTNTNQRRQPSAHNMIISSICQTFNAFQSSDRKQFPISVKDILSRFRQLHQATINANSNSTNTKKACTRLTHQRNNNNHIVKDKVVSPSLKSCVIKHASVQQSIPRENLQKQPVAQVTQQSPLRLASNVHEKVLHFENCATTSPIPVSTDQVIEPVLRPRTPPSGHAVAEVCPGGTFYPLSPKPTSKTNNQNNPEPSSSLELKNEKPPEPASAPVPAPAKSGTGRNLKRVPSKRFQKMRSKVQKLMGSRHDSTDSDEEEKQPIVLDESAFLQSVRIPTTTFSKQEAQPCLMLRQTDHDLCRIFSYLDTKTLASVKCCCVDFSFLIQKFDIRGSDSKWTNDERYLDDPCKQCRRQFIRGDTSMCRYHPKRYYSDPPYGRSYWMCCQKKNKSQPGCCTGLHDNNWLGPK